MKTRILARILVVVMAFGLFGPWGAVLRAEEDETPTTPVLTMTQPDRYVTMRPGEVHVVDVIIRNNSLYQARNVRMMPIVGANFIVEVLGSNSPININPNAQRIYQLRITPHASLEGDIFTVPFNVIFDNNLNTAMTPLSAAIIVRLDVPQTEEPRVVMSNFVTNPADITAGQPFSLTMTLSNTSRADAANVSVSLGGFVAGGLTAVGSTNNFVGNLAAGASRDVTFTLSSGAQMATGSYSVALNLRYDGQENREALTYFVTVRGREEADTTERARLAITAISRPPGIFGVGDEVPVSVTVTNHGTRAAANIRITATADSGIVPRLASIQTMATMAVGQSHTFSFAFSPTTAAQSHFHNIGFAVVYDIGAQGEDIARSGFEQFTGFNVYNPEPEEEEDEEEDENENRSVPRIIISDYTLDPLMVMANSEFDLALTLTNTHGSRSVSNILVTWQVVGPAVGGPGGTTTAAGATFTPVASSNTFFVDYIGPGGSVRHNMRLFAIPDAAPGNHTITVEFQYEDAEGNPFDASTDIGVNVRQLSRLDMTGITIQEFATLGQPVQVNFNVHNTGRTTLYNLRVRIEGEGIDASGADEIFGNFASGDFNFFWGSFFPLVPGPTIVYVIATYDDAMGERFEIVRAFNMEVMGDGGFGGDDMFFDPEWGWGDESFGDAEDGGFFASWLLWLAVGGGVILAGGIAAAVIIVVRRRNRRDYGNDIF